MPQRVRTETDQRHAAMITSWGRSPPAGRCGRLDATRAADLLRTLTCSEMHHMLLEVCGWTREQYETWLRQTREHALLGP